MIEKVKELVTNLLKEDNTGHGMSHVERVYRLALRFAEEEQADKDIVSLAALLHDVDDYKLFGMENVEKLANAKMILKKAKVDDVISEKVLEVIKTMGYKNRLNGIKPSTKEGMIVSDADMCDTLGASGILRINTYTNAHNKPFFDKNIYPIEDMSYHKYNRNCSDSGVCHIFEKVLKVKNLMQTDSGKKEAIHREKITIDFLKHIFQEEEAPEWLDYLNKKLEEYSKIEG